MHQTSVHVYNDAEKAERNQENMEVRIDEVVQNAEEHAIDYKLDLYPYYGSDASAALRAGHDIIHGLVGPGIDSSHAFERTHQTALENTAKLLFHYVQSDMIL